MYIKNIIKIILLISIFSYCDFSNPDTKKIDSLYKEGKYYQILEWIQKQELRESQNTSSSLLLWKARIYSLFPATYGISIQFYKKYIKVHPDPLIYRELFLLYLDLQSIHSMKNLISGETIPPSLLFNPTIIYLRSFLECYYKSLYYSSVSMEILSLIQMNQDPYLKLYCNLNILSLLLSKKKTTATIDLTSSSQINEYIKTDTFLIRLVQIYFSIVNSIESHQKMQILCELQSRFPDLKLINESFFYCKEQFPSSLILNRILPANKILFRTIPIEPYFDESFYIPSLSGVP